MSAQITCDCDRPHEISADCLIVCPCGLTLDCLWKRFADGREIAVAEVVGWPEPKKQPKARSLFGDD